MKNAYFYICIFLYQLIIAAPGFADLAEDPALRNAIPEDRAAGYVARIRLHTADEIKEVLEKAQKYVDGSEKFPDFDPIAVILHGPELRVFARENYQMYKGIVELAARLEAFNVIDVRVCEVQMQRDGIKTGDLPAFVDTVPYGPAEEQRLLKRGYKYF